LLILPNIIVQLKTDNQLSVVTIFLFVLYGTSLFICTEFNLGDF